jgi:hypothetical protein
MLENQLSRYGAVAKALPMTSVGKVFFAIHSLAEHVSSSTTGWLADFQHEFPLDRDGVQRVYSTIQAAVSATTSGRGDIVYVGPGKWKEEVYIINLGVRVFGPNSTALGYDGARMRPSDSSTHYAFTTKIGTAASGACFSVLAKGVEIAGFYFDGGGGYTGIYAGGGLNGCATGYGGTVYTTANASGLYVHDNFFRGGTEGTVGLYLNGPRFGCVIKDNYFERWNGAGIEIDAGNANIENALIKGNVFHANNADYGIDIYGEANVKHTLILQNSFIDGVSTAFTAGINSRAGATGVTSVCGNYFCCATPQALLVSDGHAGNYKGTYNATEVYVSEA